MKKTIKKRYSHIKKAERLEIAILLNKGYSMKSIAGALDRSVSSISNEIRNNSVKGVYDPRKAQHKAYVKRKYSKYQGMKVAGNIQLRSYVEDNIENNDWSPEQVAGRIKEIDKHIPYVSKNAIYKYIYSAYGRRLETKLKYKGQPKKGGRGKVSKLEDRIFIDERPAFINKRLEYGHWEGDFIVSGKNGSGALLVMHERLGRLTIIEKLNSRSPAVVNQKIKEITGGFVCFDSLTLDNDISFALHIELSEMIGCPVYFCHPYHSWEKGGVENANKLIREYIPKRTNISKLSVSFIKEVQDKLNNRPRKCLGFKTPLEIMSENDQIKKVSFFSKNILQFNINKNPQAVRLEG